MVDGFNKFKKFLNSINIENTEDFDMEFLSIIRSDYDNNLFIYTIKANNPLTYKLAKEFLDATKNIKNYDCKINIINERAINDHELKEFITDFFNDYLNSSLYFDITVTNDYINFIFQDDKLNEKFLNSKEYIDLQNILNFFGYKKEIKFIVNKKEEDTKIAPNEIIKAEEKFENIKAVAEENIVQNLEDNYKRMLEERRHQDAFKHASNYQHALIRDLDSNSGAVEFDGKIFEVEIKDTRSGKKFAKIGIKDKTSAIYATAFSNSRNMPPERLQELKVGKNVWIKGKVDLDRYSNELIIIVHHFEFLPEDELRKDEANEKRVELHIHTKMSEMDAVSTVEEYCKLAKNMGHKAIGITDHGVVQAFPEAQNMSKKYGIKMLYGCELYVIDDYLTGCLNPTNEKLKDLEFICFDLETTGLNIMHDKITEVGAVRIKNGFITDRLDLLINPEIEIPLEIQEKTNITQEMVSNCPTIKEALPHILEFFKGAALVSHNIEFDYNMLNEAMVNNGFGSLTAPGLDTLAFSRYFFPDSARHRLGSLCKRLDIDYDEESAHRADYDAEVLSKCFLSIRSMFLKENKELTLNDLEHLTITTEMLKKRSFKNFHYTVYAKNRQGLKDLYRIVSESHINYMGYVPSTPKSLLEKYRENLIIGSACFNGEVFYACGHRNLKSLQKAIEFCDFIEIQPLECYSFLVNYHIDGMYSIEDVKRNLLTIINEAKKLNKIICATGDVHYAELDEKIYREILIANNSVGKGLHPLKPMDGAINTYGRHESPDQYFLSTVEMIDAFKWLNNEEDIYNFVIKNTNLIADMCEEIQPIPSGLYTPKIDNCENLLKDIVYKSAHEIYGDVLPKLIEERLEQELNGIISNGFSVIYYIAHKLVQKANEDGYLVGSRGSVGSSLVATMAKITEVNPLPPHYHCPKCRHVEFYEGKDITSGYDLPEKRCPECGEIMIADGQSIPFQTFLGFKAEKVPDIDLNFPTDYQATAHDYTKVLLGEKNVYRAGTISAVQFKTAMGYVNKGYFEEYLKLKPSELPPRAVRNALAYGCTDVKRTTGQHPGGIVVVPRDYEVYDFTPIQYPAGDDEANWQTTHFDFHSIHDTILKLDMLGHVDPQALKMMSDLSHIDCRTVPLNDPKVISIFSSDDALNLSHKYMQKDNGALGLPEFGTQFVRQMLRETKPKTFRDLVIISGLSHGTDVWNNNAQDLINSGITDLKGVIGCRDDIMTYLISLGMDASQSFKIMETVRKGKPLKSEDIEAMKEHKVPDFYIDSCKKIKYLFPKGHACAYVMMAIRVAFYKVYYPLEYYATYFSLRCEQYDIESMIKGIDGINDKLIEYKQRRASNNPDQALSNKEEEIEKMLLVALEMTERGYKFTNLNLEKSDGMNFVIDYENKALIPPFKVLDGLGEKAAQSIIEARNEKSFISKEDLRQRGKLTVTNMALLEKLGVLNNLSETSQMSLFSFEF